MNDGITGDRSGVGVNFESDLRQRGLRQDIPETGIGIKPSNTQERQDVLLLCENCAVVYPKDDHWNNCPRCGDELREVEKA